MMPDLSSDTETFCRIPEEEVQEFDATWEVSLRKKEVTMMRTSECLRSFGNPFISRLLIF